MRALFESDGSFIVHQHRILLIDARFVSGYIGGPVHGSSCRWTGEVRLGADEDTCQFTTFLGELVFPFSPFFLLLFILSSFSRFRFFFLYCFSLIEWEKISEVLH